MIIYKWEEEKQVSGIIEEETEKSLLSFQFVSLKGEIYRVVFGEKEITTITSTFPLNIKDGTILYAQEKDAGLDFTKYTMKTISVDKSVSYNSQTLANKYPNYVHVPKYELNSMIFNYKIVPTLDRGPKILKENIVPNYMILLDGRLESALVEKQRSNDIQYKTLRQLQQDTLKDLPIPTKSKIKMDRTSQLEITI